MVKKKSRAKWEKIVHVGEEGYNLQLPDGGLSVKCESYGGDNGTILLVSGLEIRIVLR